jgi:hypothetical protein
MTYVTCPTMRYHPAVVAQKAATLALLSEGRFTLGLGSGENLNEHAVGRGWPSADVRQEMLAIAVSGSRSVERYAPMADAMVAVEPSAELVREWDAAAGTALPKIGQQPRSTGPPPTPPSPCGRAEASRRARLEETADSPALTLLAC